MDSIQAIADIAAKEYTTGQDAPDGEAAPEMKAALTGEAAREARHAEQLRDLGILRYIGMEIAAGLAHAAAGRHQFNTNAFVKVTDPAASFNCIAHAIRRIIALENRLDEDAETRAARLAEEKVALERKIARESQDETKRIVRRAVTEAHKDANPKMDRDRRENLLDDLFDDYDDYHKGTLAEIIAGICADLGLTPDLTLWQDNDDPDGGGKPDPAEVKARTMELAEDYLKSVTQTAARPPPAQPPKERGRGPPD